MKVTINGENRELPEGLTVAALLEHLGLQPERVAIERNREILPRSRWAETRVADGDRYEIVHFVGGG
ncbi:MAG: sulfur carrier protein ThiS [Acidobacteriia bacterium]|jgi:thiamine biosynthesis protein ThiS|nr:sulfur carrier protein ThiS [Terriglobia bacterium]